MSKETNKLPRLSVAEKKAVKQLQSGIYNSDCVSGMQQIPDGSIDLVFADPPFNIGYKYDVYEDQRAAEDYLQWSGDWMAEVYRALKDSGTFWLAIGDDFAAELKLKAQSLGFHCRCWVIWYYTFGVNCKFKFTRSHTHLLYFVKDRKNFTFRSEDLENRIPSARMLVYNDKRTNPKGRLPDDTWIIPPDVPATFALRPQDLQDCFLPNESDWYFPRVAGTFKERAGFHGCQMPEQLLGRIVRSCSEEDEIVLDPFSGSASTMIVAKKLKRRHMAFELSSEYAKAGRERLDAVEEGDELVGDPEPKMSALPTWRESQKRAAKARATAKSSVPKSPAKQPAETKANDSEPPGNAFVDALARISEELQSDLPDGSSLAQEIQKTITKGVVQAFTEIADRYSLSDLESGKRALNVFHKECQKLNLPGDASANLELLKQAFRNHGQLF